ncbi:MAG: tryptophan 7-halogenase [Bacteroidota bacterium]
MAATLLALSLLREQPHLRLLLVEKSTKFPDKVGESISDVTALFLNRFNIPEILGQQTQKSGLRFLFNEHQSADFGQMDEFCGPSFKSLANGYHLHRSSFDQALLEAAQQAGAEVWRPAEVVEMGGGDFNYQIKIRREDEDTLVQSRWVVDASGTARLLAGWLDLAEQDLPLQTGAVFAHWDHLPPPEERWDTQPNPVWETRAIGPRSLATLHFLRKGCWWWHIRLLDGRTSLGIVYDKEQWEFAEACGFYQAFLEEDAQLRQIIRGGIRGPVHHFPHLPYLAESFSGLGWALLGDAAGFVDPLFSPGLELTVQQLLWLKELLLRDLQTQHYDLKAWTKYNATFKRAFIDRMYIHRQGYQLMHSFDLFTNWTQLGLLAYYLFVVIPGLLVPSRLKFPVHFNALSRWSYGLLIKRYLTIANNRVRENRHSTSLPKPIAFSYINLSSRRNVILQVPRLAGIWLLNYLRIEWTEFKRLFSQKTPDPSKVPITSLAGQKDPS